MPHTPADPGPELRFPNVSRRAFLRRSAVVGLAAAAVPALAACGASTTSTPGTSTPGTTTPGTATPDAAGGGSTSTAATTTTQTGSIAISEQPTATNTPAADPIGATDAPSTSATQGFPSGAQLQINFTYEAGGGGRIHSPYIAVWIEDPAGDLVQTVSLWYKSDEGKYLKDLRLWNSKNNRDALTTGATRIPGAFAVAWNGTDLDGAIVPGGDYFVCIEAAREDGPYQIIRESVPVSGALAPTALTPNGELTAASVELVA